MNRYNIVITSKWRWWKPWKMPEFGIQQVAPVDNRWPDQSFVWTCDVERIETINMTLTNTLEQTNKELIKERNKPS